MRHTKEAHTLRITKQVLINKKLFKPLTFYTILQRSIIKQKNTAQQFFINLKREKNRESALTPHYPYPLLLFFEVLSTGAIYFVMVVLAYLDKLTLVRNSLFCRSR